MEGAEEPKTICLFGTQFGTVLVDETNTDRQLFGSYCPGRRTGFFQVVERPDGKLELQKFVEVSEEDYLNLQRMGVFG